MSIVLIFVALGFGLATGGLVKSIFEAVTSRRASFQTRFDQLAGNMFLAVSLTFCGPLIILRNSYYGLQAGRHPGFVMVGFTIAFVWSLVAGLAVLSVLQRLF